MRKMTTSYWLSLSFGIVLLTTACRDENNGGYDPEQSGSSTISEEEVYAGGKLGTTFNSSASAYEDPTPAVEEAGLTDKFKYGEYFFERTYTQNSAPFNGLGPLYVRSACINCHPGYGHGKRMERYRADEWGNGYLLVIYDKTTSQYITSLTGMPQTKAVEPFKTPLDEEQIEIKWIKYTDEWGNKFDDGETYDLIYPEVYIPESAFYIKPGSEDEPVSYTNMEVRLESTIGIYGTGLLDAIPDDSLKAEYARQEKLGVPVNPAFFKNGEWVKQYANSIQGNGKQEHPFRFTYALSRGPLLDAAGTNAIWNITNVTRSDRRYHYMTKAYARKASKDADVQARFYQYFPEYNLTGNVEKDIYNYLMGKDMEGNDMLPAEMKDDDYVDFAIWHRGLAVPAARDLDDPQVQKGHQLFREIGCSFCHRPSWTTGEDKFTDPNLYFADGDARLPRYPYQKIWPYSDLVQHRLFMENDIRTGWCRTTPLWGRGLSPICAGHEDRLHDCRARNVIEAIMWHGNAQSDARFAIEKFRKLNKEERDAVVKFINAI